MKFCFLLILLPVPTFGWCDDRTAGTIRTPQISESSGIAVSYQNEDCLWVHNDSGDGPNLYLITETGALRAKVELADTRAFDWEDMSSFVVDGQPWLLIGDVGDNLKARGRRTPRCELLLVQERKIPPANGLPTVTWPVHTRISFDYEDGEHNCEGVAVDSRRKEILLLTKATPAECGVYQLPLDLTAGTRQQTARKIASPFVLFATALDVSPDGRQLAIGTMLNGSLVRRKHNESWADAFRRPGRNIALPPRRQGETICFDRTARWLFVNSEGTNQPLWKVALLPDSPAGSQP